MNRILSALPIGVLVLAGCAMPVQSPEARGAKLFANNCTSCHGTKALGDGPLAAGLDVQPANLTLLSERNGGSFPTEEVIAQIHGYSGRHKFGSMPEFAQELAGPTVDWLSRSGEVIPTPQALIDLARYLESIQQ